MLFLLKCDNAIPLSPNCAPAMSLYSTETENAHCNTYYGGIVCNCRFHVTSLEKNVMWPMLECCRLETRLQKISSTKDEKRVKTSTSLKNTMFKSHILANVLSGVYISFNLRMTLAKPRATMVIKLHVDSYVFSITLISVSWQGAY